MLSPHDRATTLVEAEPGAFLPFAGDSMVRRVHSEGVLLLGGGRALLLQLAHPSVAAGVAEHSRFREEGLPRLTRTLRTMYTIAFGSRTQALEAARHVNGLHRHVRGEGYTALDPQLLMWVLATLVDTSLVVHERFLRPLTGAEAEAYYADMRRVGRLFGLHDAEMPPDVEAFRAYFDSAVSGLQVSDTGRELARDVFRLSPWLAPAMHIYRVLTAGLLPEPVREQLSLSWGTRREAALSVVAAASRSLLPLVPRGLRAPPWFVMPSRSDTL